MGSFFAARRHPPRGSLSLVGHGSRRTRGDHCIASWLTGPPEAPPQLYPTGGEGEPGVLWSPQSTRRAQRSRKRVKAASTAAAASYSGRAPRVERTPAEQALGFGDIERGGEAGQRMAQRHAGVGAAD